MLHGTQELRLQLEEVQRELADTKAELRAELSRVEVERDHAKQALADANAS